MTTQRETRNPCPHTTEWLTVKQVCHHAHLSRTFLYEQWACGTGPRYTQIGGKRLVKDVWLESWLLSQEVRA